VAINFPTSLDNFTNPSSGNTLDSPSHSLQHSDINDAVEAMQRKVGVGTAVAGSASAGQVLTISAAGTSTWSTPSAKILQVVNATHSTTTSTTSTSYITTNITASITPASATNKILVIAQVPTRKVTSNVFSGAAVALFRGTVAGSNISANEIYSDTNTVATITFSVLDSPNTTSSQTYTIGLKTNSNLTTVETCPSTSPSASITLLEVAV
jgi:hypothetical protein